MHYSELHQTHANTHLRVDRLLIKSIAICKLLPQLTHTEKDHQLFSVDMQRIIGQYSLVNIK